MSKKIEVTKEVRSSMIKASIIGILNRATASMSASDIQKKVAAQLTELKVTPTLGNVRYILNTLVKSKQINYDPNLGKLCYLFKKKISARSALNEKLHQNTPTHRPSLVDKIPDNDQCINSEIKELPKDFSVLEIMVNGILVILGTEDIKTIHITKNNSSGCPRLLIEAK